MLVRGLSDKFRLKSHLRANLLQLPTDISLGIKFLSLFELRSSIYKFLMRLKCLIRGVPSTLLKRDEISLAEKLSSASVV